MWGSSFYSSSQVVLYQFNFMLAWITNIKVTATVVMSQQVKIVSLKKENISTFWSKRSAFGQSTKASSSFTIRLYCMQRKFLQSNFLSLKWSIS